MHKQTRQKELRVAFNSSIRLINHLLFRLFTAFNAHFTLVQFRSAVLATEISAAPDACHEGHPDSIFGFASITLASAAGFGHRDVSTILVLVHDMAMAAGRGPRPPHVSFYTDSTSVFAAPIQDRYARVVRITFSLRR